MHEQWGDAGAVSGVRYNSAIVTRLRHILLNAAAALSLLLCLATAADWGNSYRRYWLFWRETGEGATVIASDWGTIYLFRDRGQVPRPDPGVHFEYHPEESGGSGLFEDNFDTRRQWWKPVRLLSRTGLGSSSQCVIISHWVLVILLAVAPLLRLRAWRRRRRRTKIGTCAKCGYDLRATPGRCPECGTVT
jgi:hypothetical protein